MPPRIPRSLGPTLLFTFATFAALVITSQAAGVRAEETWKAGAAKVVITPSQFMWMSGYGGRNKPAEGRLADLWAKVLVLEDQRGKRAVMVGLDLVGIDRETSRRICEQLRKKHGLEREQIALFASHTHCGPVVGKNLGPLHYLQIDDEQKKLVDKYEADLQRLVEGAVAEAIGKLEPVQLSWGSGTATFAVNRRQNGEPRVPELRTAGQLKGPFDHDVPVLAVRGRDGSLKSVLFGYACHATVMDFYQWSPDYPGFAQKQLEQTHPGCVAVFFAGCGADQNPLPRRKVELLEHYGRRLADAVDAVLLTSTMTELPSQLTTSYREIDLALAPLPDRQQFEKDAASSDRFAAARAKMLLAQLDAGQTISPTYPYPISTWTIGGVKLVILGGEVVVDYAVRLKAELSGTQTWVSGYSNDVMAYIPSRRVLLEGGYEGGGAMTYYGLPTIWAESCEQQIVEEVHRQLKGR